MIRYYDHISYQCMQKIMSNGSTFLRSNYNQSMMSFFVLSTGHIIKSSSTTKFGEMRYQEVVYVSVDKKERGRCIPLGCS